MRLSCTGLLTVLTTRAINGNVHQRGVLRVPEKKSVRSQYVDRNKNRFDVRRSSIHEVGTVV